MGKTHEALERAEEEYQMNFLGHSRQPLAEVVSAPPPKQATNHNAMESYDDLKTNLLTRYLDGSIKSILFMGMRHGGGCSTTAVNLATALARDSKLKVLLIDVNLRTPGLHDVFAIDHALGVSDLSTNRGNIMSLVKKVIPGNLHVLTCGANTSVPLVLFEDSRFDQLLKDMREWFDYVILDAPPVLRFSECRVLCSKVDGVILVLEAGKTRQQVALRATKALEEAEGKLLGVVLNRKKYYIPDWIYKRL